MKNLTKCIRISDGINFYSNHLNLPTQIYFANGNSIEYFYNAVGQKMGAVSNMLIC